MTTGSGTPDAERRRLAEADAGTVPWQRWGPYLSERQWGTVREDYSENGDAWSYFSHDQARSRAYRWGENGIAGVSDDKQRLCFALALWNGPDDLLIESTAHHRGPDEADLHLLPTLWFRHTWSWAGGTAVPALHATDEAIRADHEELGPRRLHHQGGETLFILHCEYFHGDTGAGLGASHQTDRTGLVAATAALFHSVRSGRESLRPSGDREEPLS